MSLVAGALASKGVTPEAIAKPVDDGPVQLNFGLIQAYGRRDRCLAAMETEVVSLCLQTTTEPGRQAAASRSITSNLGWILLH